MVLSQNFGACRLSNENSVILAESGGISDFRCDVSVTPVPPNVITYSQSPTKLQYFTWYGRHLVFNIKREVQFFVFFDIFAKTAFFEKNQKLLPNVTWISEGINYLRGLNGLNTLSWSNFPVDMEHDKNLSFWSNHTPVSISCC